jgi:lipoprotein-releasing system permease protein
MSVSSFIAQKLALSKNKTFTSLIIRLAWIGVALSVSVMIIAVSVVIGYKKQISEKVIGFNGHLEIHSTGSTGNFDYTLFTDSTPLVNDLKKIKDLGEIQPIIAKPGILKSDEEVEGIIFKGVSANYNFNFFNKNLIKGNCPNTSDSTRKREIMVSQLLAKKLKLDTGQKVKIFFINEPVRVIPCKITGIYETGLEESDQVMVIGSLKEMQRIFANKNQKITHYEITTSNTKNLAQFTDLVHKKIPLELAAQNMIQLNPQIFDWLGYLDQNISIILTLMIVVACINMMTALLVLIIERTNMIGVLKAVGSTNKLIRKIFLNHAFYILLIGLILGNILGLSISLIQQHYHVIKLPQETYYLSYVPIHINWFFVLLINIGTVSICMISLLIPSRMISNIHPVKAIKFN